LPYFRDSNRLTGVFITAESITNTNNPTNNRKNLKLFLGMPFGTRRSCLMKKNGDEKSHDTVPLMRGYTRRAFVHKFLNYSYIFIMHTKNVFRPQLSLSTTTFPALHSTISPLEERVTSTLYFVQTLIILGIFSRPSIGFLFRFLNKLFYFHISNK
jgi:hypothetical protein